MDVSVKLGPREEEVARLLLQGCDNREIAKVTKMAYRTVKAHMGRLFLRFKIESSGVRRVKLAALLYKEYPQWRDTETEQLPAEKVRLSA